MDRQPALIDPRTPMPPPEPRRTPRPFPWAFLWLGGLTLAAAAGVAWVSLNPDRIPTLNVQSPSATNAPGGAAAGKSDDAARGLDRAFAIAFVDVEPGVTHLYPVRPGRVVEVYAKEGDAVEKDQPLLKVDDELAREQVAEAELALSGARLRKQEAEQLAVRHRGAVRAQEKLIAVRESEVAEAEAHLAKARHYYEKRLGGSREDIRIAESVVAKAKKGVEAEQEKLASLRELDPSIAVRAAEVEIQSKEHLVKKARLELGNYVLRAPGKGKILRSFVSVGETLGTNPQRAAMEFAPAGELIVRAELEQEFAGQVRPGMKARIQDYDSTSDTYWDGEVTRVSDWIAKRRHQVFEPLQFNDVRTLEVIIKLKSDAKPTLRIGQRLRVSLDR